MVYFSTDINMTRLAVYLSIEVMLTCLCAIFCVGVKHAIDTKIHLLQRCSPNSDFMLCVHI